MRRDNEGRTLIGGYIWPSQEDIYEIQSQEEYL